MRIIKEAGYMDAEEQFYDYGTGPVTDEVLFDTTTTGESEYRDLLRDPERARARENKDVTIEYMTPTEYFEACVDIFNSRSNKDHSVQNELYCISRETDIVNHLKDVILKYKRKFPIGYLDFGEFKQEGRHRMYVAGELVGWDVEQPVIVVRWHDEELASEQKRQQEYHNDQQHIRRAVSKTLNFRYSNIDELRDQLQWELNREYGVDIDESDIEFTLESDDANEQFIVRCGVADDTIDYSEVDFKDKPDIDIDDLDLELDELPDGDLDSWLKKYLGESLSGPSLAETLEKHDTLNPAIWDGEELKEGVQDAILEIVGKYIEDSEVLSIDDVIDVELLGSNASFNYTSHSDLDIHIVVNMEALSSDPALVQIACNAEKALFNKAYNFTIKGVEVELYVEDVKAATASNGVFSVTNDEWIKKPQPIDIPDMTDDESYISLLDTWMVRAKRAMNSESSKDVQSFINELYNLRRLSIMTDGEYARGNLVFKEIRNAGILSDLKDLVNELSSKELSLESLQ